MQRLQAKHLLRSGFAPRPEFATKGVVKPTSYSPLSIAAVLMGSYLLVFALLCLDEFAGWGIFRELPETVQEGLRWLYYPIVAVVRVMMGAPHP